jgi:hypothetical protein
VKLFDPIRRRFVEATPEEKVRQALIEKMVRELQFPKGLLAVERAIFDLPQARRAVDSGRRIDLLSFACHVHPEHEVFPLLLIECKQGRTRAAKEQVIGYNDEVGAPFVAVAGSDGIETLIEAEWTFGLPPFPALVKIARELFA